MLRRWLTNHKKKSQVEVNDFFRQKCSLRRGPEGISLALFCIFFLWLFLHFLHLFAFHTFRRLAAFFPPQQFSPLRPYCATQVVTSGLLARLVKWAALGIQCSSRQNWPWPTCPRSPRPPAAACCKAHSTLCTAPQECRQCPCPFVSMSICSATNDAHRTSAPPDVTRPPPPPPCRARRQRKGYNTPLFVCSSAWLALWGEWCPVHHERWSVSGIVQSIVGQIQPPLVWVNLYNTAVLPRGDRYLLPPPPPTTSNDPLMLFL